MYKSITYDEDLLEDLFNLNLFSSKSPALSHYYEDTVLWELMKNSAKDKELIKLMIFNLNFNIAPLHTFLQYYKKELESMQLSSHDKRCLGSIVTIIFISLGYQTSRRIYRSKSIIKYAAFFVKKLKEEGT